MTGRSGSELEALIGEAALVRLAETFGGTRLLIPRQIGPGHAIAKAIGTQMAQRLSDRLAPDVIKVPLAREQRARHYRRNGASNAQIARALGITETGVELLFKRVARRGDDRQPLLI